MKRKRLSLSVQIVLSNVLPMVLLGTLMCLSFFLVLKQTFNNDIKQLTATTVEKLDNQVSAILYENSSGVKYLRDLLKFDHSKETADIAVEAFTQGMPDDYSLYYGTLISRFEKGGFYSDSSGWIPDDDWLPPNRPWFQDAVKNPGKIVITDPYVDSMTGKICTTISADVRDEKNNLLGVCAIDLILDDLSNAVSNIKISENAKAYLVNNQGYFITHTDTKLVMEKTIYDDELFVNSGLSKDGFLTKENSVQIAGDNFFGVMKSSDSPWYIVVCGPVSDFTRVNYGIFSRVTLVMILIIIAASVLLAFLGRRIAKDFKKMVVVCKSISAGDFTQKVGNCSSKEAVELADGFNQFTENISSLINNVHFSTYGIDNVSKELENAAVVINQSVGTTNTTVENVSESVEKQIASVNQINESVNDIVDQIENLNCEIESQDRIIDESCVSIGIVANNVIEVNKQIEKTSSDVAMLVDFADKNKNELKESVNQIMNVKQQSKTLLDTNSIIASVANKTNLLAMNAAIEAAHAGEAGKGFAVVADEIRKLAETTSKQAQSSSEALKLIQDKIDEISTTSVNVENAFEQTISKIGDIEVSVGSLKVASEAQGQKAQEILSALDNMKNSSIIVKTNAERIVDVTSTTKSICDEMTSISNNVKDNLVECKGAVSALDNASEGISRIVQVTGSSVSDLTQSVASFKVEEEL